MVFAFGLVFGSFFNVVGLRVPLGKSIISPRSHCMKCGHTLRPIELIPVFSFTFQKGKCRVCGIHLPKIYLLVEILTGTLFVLAIYEIGFKTELIVALSLISLLMIIVVSDVTYMIISDRILVIFLILFVFERSFIPLYPYWSSVIGAIGAFLFMLLITLISKGGMGGGDIKLFGVLGFLLGWKLTLVTFMLACFAGTIFGLVIILMDKIKRRNPIPFGPFIAIGALISYFYGEEIVRWYIRFL
ncbi:prepilin peptidase [Gottfriedia luciferensis]|uniref:prepilin peptidase n=1 Tax=Gottfriedia luciferensis TaxID=178774 RepID=UPI001ABF729E|nr:A24 family peptidase [Gottfriedia luciferensis]